VSDEQFDAYMDQFGAMIDEYGWGIQGVGTAVGDEPHPPWVYSVGLTKNFGHPEIAIVGIPMQTGQNLINEVGARIKDDKLIYEAGHPYEGIVIGYPVIFRSIPQEVFPDWFGVMMGYYRQQGIEDYKVMQLMWPDREKHFPWEPEFDQSMLIAQPLIGQS
jgi:hypothetical protein